MYRRSYTRPPQTDERSVYRLFGSENPWPGTATRDENRCGVWLSAFPLGAPEPVSETEPGAFPAPRIVGPSDLSGVWWSERVLARDSNLARNGTSVTLLIVGEISSTRSTSGNGLVEQQDLLLVGRLKTRCPPFEVSSCHRRGCPLARCIATFSSLD